MRSQRSRRSILSILTLCCAACATGPETRTAEAPPPGAAPIAVLDLLRRRDSATDWDRRSLLRADLDLDGGEDYAVAGVRKDRFVVAIVHGPVSVDSPVWILDFPWDGSEDALCSKKAKITLESLEENEGIKAGHPRRGTGINVHDDLCDAFHIYWNPDEQKFEWWRL